MKTCKNLQSLIDTETEVIKRHIEEHKFLNQITDYENAYLDFIQKFGWLMKEMYCVYACQHRDGCEISEKLKERGDLLRDKR